MGTGWPCFESHLLLRTEDVAIRLDSEDCTVQYRRLADDQREGRLSFF